MPRKKENRVKEKYPDGPRSMEVYYPEKVILDILKSLDKDIDFMPILKQGLFFAANIFFIDKSHSDNSLTKTELVSKFTQITNSLRKLSSLLDSFSVNEGDNALYIDELFRNSDIDSYEFRNALIKASDVANTSLDKLKSHKGVYHFEGELSKSFHVTMWLEALSGFWETHLKDKPFSAGSFNNDIKDQKGGSVIPLMKMLLPIMPKAQPTDLAEAFKTYRSRKRTPSQVGGFPMSMPIIE